MKQPRRETILLIGHGSRDDDGNQEVKALAAYWQSRHPQERVEVCFIELVEPLLAEGLRQAAAGSDRVIALPLILNAAGHVKTDIPEAIRQAQAAMPNVEFCHGRHLGGQEPILELLRKRLHGALVTLDLPDPHNTGVLLLSRGSSDRAANADVARMARWIFETTGHTLVDYAFTSITEPRLEGMVQRMVRLGMMQIIVLPYFLFTGCLIKRITRQVARLRTQYPHIAFAQAGYLGIDDHLVAVLDQRLAQIRQGETVLECDGCKGSGAQRKFGTLLQTARGLPW
ncbi:MAG: sirohydrochlorin chelatase [Magnetococcales bacterium]|nr:sirohydrochlorin chelatase [Magnetococcales bacterium]